MEKCFQLSLFLEICSSSFKEEKCHRENIYNSSSKTLFQALGNLDAISKLNLDTIKKEIKDLTQDELNLVVETVYKTKNIQLEFWSRNIHSFYCLAAKNGQQFKNFCRENHKEKELSINNFYSIDFTSITYEPILQFEGSGRTEICTK